MTTTNISWRVPPWAWAPIALAITAEASINALRAYGLGQHLEHFTVNVAMFGFSATVSIAGAVLVLAAIAISLAQARAAWVAFRPGAMARQRALAAPIAILLLAVSVSALALTLLEAQRGKSGDEGGQRTAYDTAKGAYDKADEELRRLEGTRTTAEVRAAMDAAPVSRRVFTRTAECTDMTREDSFEACRPILDLRQEMARAIRKIELDQAMPSLKATLDAAPRPAEPTWVEEQAASVWGWLMGLAVVLVATFGAPLFAVPVRANGSDDRSAGTERSDDKPVDPGANCSPNGLKPEGSAPVRAQPNGPVMPNGSASVAPRAANGSDAERRADVLAFIRNEAAIGNPIRSQEHLADTLGVPRSTLSEMLAALEAEGAIVRRIEGRRKVITVPDRELVAA